MAWHRPCSRQQPARRERPASRRRIPGSRAPRARTARLFAEAGGQILCSAVIVDDDWSPRIELSDEQWEHVARGLEQVGAAANEEGVRHVLHPHWGTLVERDEDVRRILEISDVGFCLDTGHLTLGGCDPLEFAHA